MFKSVGAFEELISSGDSEYGERLKTRGIDVNYEENAIVYHPSRKSFEEIEKKLLRIAYGEGQRAKKQKKSITQMRIIYFCKAVNLINLVRLYNKMKTDIDLQSYLKFAFQFTKIRLRQKDAFVKGFYNENLMSYNL